MPDETRTLPAQVFDASPQPAAPEGPAEPATPPAPQADHKKTFAHRFGEDALRLVEDIGKAGVTAPELIVKWTAAATAEQRPHSSFVGSGETVVVDLLEVLANVGAASLQHGTNWNQDAAALKAIEKLLTDAPAFIDAIRNIRRQM